jgi:hypothetical protein
MSVVIARRLLQSGIPGRVETYIRVRRYIPDQRDGVLVCDVNDWCDERQLARLFCSLRRAQPYRCSFTKLAGRHGGLGADRVNSHLETWLLTLPESAYNIRLWDSVPLSG